MAYKIKYLFYFLLMLFNMHFAAAQSKPMPNAAIIYQDDFKKDNKNWVAEFEQPLGSSIKISNGKLDLNAAIGATVWYKNKIAGNIIITYNATVVDAGGKNDRVSDLNVFWMATNPTSDNIFQQDGKFSSYDNLHLYYAGIGGHDNTTTRFRKYAGSDGKKVLKEYTDKEHMLEGNKKYAIKIIVNNGLVQYFINEKLFWEYTDASPYTEGYVGFRTTTSHQIFEDFKVYQIKN
jgi:rhamnogalacturonan endolyase